MIRLCQAKFKCRQVPHQYCQTSIKLTYVAYFVCRCNIVALCSHQHLCEPKAPGGIICTPEDPVFEKLLLSRLKPADLSPDS